MIAPSGSSVERCIVGGRMLKSAVHICRRMPVDVFVRRLFSGDPFQVAAVNLGTPMESDAALT